MILNGLFLISISGKKWIIKDSESYKDNLKTITIALWIALLIRSLILQPFFIPSASMEPGLMNGDRIFATKYDVGYSRHSFPLSINILEGRIFFNQLKRGDVVIFKPPGIQHDYIKRLVGLPGEKIKLVDGQIYINSKPIKIEFTTDDDNGSKIYKETTFNGVSYEIRDIGKTPQDNTIMFCKCEEFTIPENYYFFMGDNRDNSRDSRFFGPVSQDRIVAKPKIIFFATKDGSSFIKFWRWPFDIQFERLFKFIK